MLFKSWNIFITFRCVHLEKKSIQLSLVVSFRCVSNASTSGLFFLSRKSLECVRFPKMNVQPKPSQHIVHFAAEPQQVFIHSDSQLLGDTSVRKGCFSDVGAFMYNAAEKTILGKTKEKWLFILLGLLVAFLFVFFVVNMVQRTAEASASEFTFTRRNDTGEYYVIRRELAPDSTGVYRLWFWQWQFWVTTDLDCLSSSFHRVKLKKYIIQIWVTIIWIYFFIRCYCLIKFC